MSKYYYVARKAIGSDEPGNYLLRDNVAVAEFGDEQEGQEVYEIIAALEAENARLREALRLARWAMDYGTEQDEKDFQQNFYPVQVDWLGTGSVKSEQRAIKRFEETTMKAIDAALAKEVP